MRCWDCGLPRHRFMGDGFTSCDCPRCRGCGEGLDDCVCADYEDPGDPWAHWADEDPAPALFAAQRVCDEDCMDIYPRPRPVVTVDVLGAL